MGQARKPEKLQAGLDIRIAAFNRLGVKEQAERRRPGSLNPKRTPGPKSRRRGG